MLLSRYLIFTLMLICYYGVNYVSANAGLIVPVPKESCNPQYHRGCKNKLPCHDGDTDGKEVNEIDINSDYDIGIFQLDAMPTKSDQSTYTLQYFPTDDRDISVQLLTFNQKSFKQNNATIKITMPPIKEIHGFKKLKFDENNYSFGIVELTFDARENPNSNETEDRVFYSCARVRLQKKAIKIRGTEVKIDTTLTIEDTVAGIGNAVADNNETTIIIPKLVPHDKESSQSGSLGNKDPNGELNAKDDDEEHGNDSNLLIIPFALVTLLSIICSFF